VSAATSVFASTVYDASADFTGVRSVGATGGLIDGGGHGYDNLVLSWSIVSLPDWTYSYQYTLRYREAPDPSRIVLDLGNQCAAPAKPTDNISAACASNAKVNGAPAVIVLGNWCGSLCQSSGGSGAIAGLEFVQLPRAASSLTISFTAPGAPVWGDFYIAGGFQYLADAGILNHVSGNPLNFIAVPGTAATAAPEPGTLALAGVFLMLLAAIGNRRRR